MLIVSGTTILKGPQGFAADHCAFCRCPETVRVLGAASQVPLRGLWGVGAQSGSAGVRL